MKHSSFAPVSVVIPCFNCKETIERTTKSVFEQTWRPAEVIIVDDASTDESLQKLLELQDIYGSDWLKVVYSKENRGPGTARNRGWDIATQPFIAFLDADDTWHPEKIAIQLSYMLEHPDLAITGHITKWIRADGNTTIKPLPMSYSIKPISRLQMLLSNRLATRSVILKREIDLRFEPNKRFSEDYLLWLHIILSGYKVALINLPLAYAYKAPYGEGGLSARLWNMQKGELDTFDALRKSDNLCIVQWLFLSLYSFLKFILRLIKCVILNLTR